MKLLLLLYPPAWQRRYRREVELHLEDTGASGLRTALDLIAGAVDAWLNQDPTPDSDLEGKDAPLTSEITPRSLESITPGDGIRFARTILIVTAVIVAFGVFLDKTIGSHLFIDAMIYSAGIVALIVGAWPYLRSVSPGGRIAITTVGVLSWYAVVFALLVALAQV